MQTELPVAERALGRIRPSHPHSNPSRVEDSRSKTAQRGHGIRWARADCAVQWPAGGCGWQDAGPCWVETLRSSVRAAAAIAFGAVLVGIGGGVAVLVGLLIGIGRRRRLIVIAGLRSVLAELDLTVDLAQVVLIIVRGDLSARASCRNGPALGTTAEEIPEDEAEYGNEENDECPRGFGQDSNQTPIAQQAIEESVQCHRCCQDNRGNEKSSHASRIVHEPEHGLKHAV